MNYMVDVAHMFGVKMHEDFKIRNGERISEEYYRFTEHGLYCITDSLAAHKCCDVLNELIIGNYKIVKKPWKPDSGSIYYYVKSDKTVSYTYFDGSNYDIVMYALGNCFSTKEEITLGVLKEVWQKCYGAYFKEGD